MIKRAITSKMISLLEKIQVITLTGPRQSGKTTLVKTAFPNLPYVSLENPEFRQIALSDPRDFLASYPDGAILDEVQNTPELFSYIQSIVDEDRKIRFILTGSANFLLLEKITQTLAGRTAILHLLPFSLTELKNSISSSERYENLIFRGLYPRIYDRDLVPEDFYPSYIQTYVERDVRMIKNIGDINNFIHFIQLCAGRTGQLLNYTSLADDAGISPNTAKTWLSILESSYIVYRLSPYYKNFNKRIRKSPKIYFYDTGVASSLLGIQNEKQINSHYMRGALFENFIMNEFMKRSYNQGKRHFSYFWQNHRGKEIDCLLDNGDKILPIEIKSGKTLNYHFFDNLKYWRNLTKAPEDWGYVVYGGEKTFKSSIGSFVSWRDIEQIQF